MEKDLFARNPEVTWVNPRAAGFIPSPGTPTIAFLVEKSRIGLLALDTAVPIFHSFP